MSTKEFAPAPVALTAAQKASYRADGFLILRAVFTPDEVTQLAADVDRVCRENAALIDWHNMRVRFKPHEQTGEPVFEVFDPLADLSPIARRMTGQRRILDPLADLYGEPAELFKDKLIYKPPGAAGAALHQDWISWPDFPETFVTVLLAIDPFTEENGATLVYPGVHRQGYLSPHDQQHHLLAHDAMPTEPVPLLLEPGDLAIFSCFAPHYSNANQSDASRRGYFISYNARSDGGQQYLRHYREFHDWIRGQAPAEVRDTLYFR